MKRRPSDRKGNYASIVKENMRMPLAGLARMGRNMQTNPQQTRAVAKERA
jgi:hypothetical protein